MNTVRESFVLAVTPAGAGVGADVAGLREYLDGVTDLDALLVSSSSILFRGFGVTEADVPALLDRLLPDRMNYVHGNSPRTRTGQALYTSTEYPPNLTISLHHEMSYAATYPTRLAFFCATPAATGGASPLADGETWLNALDPQVREMFAGGVRYIQNLHGGSGLGRSWQQTYETDDRARVEQHLVEAQVEWRWLPDGTLHTEQIRRSTLRHPVTGRTGWFNQADQYHPAGLEGGVGAMLADLMPPEELPQYVTLADGRPIPDDAIRHVQEIGRRGQVDVQWESGDLVLVDNLALAHGRNPFTGTRRVLVAMSSRPFDVPAAA